MSNSALSKLNNHRNFVLGRLTSLRLVISTLLFCFLVYLKVNHFSPMLPLWIILSGYIPLLIIGFVQSKSSISSNSLSIHLLIETQLITLFLYFTGGASNPLISYFLVLIVIAAYNLKKPWVWFIAATCIMDYSLLTQYYLPIESSMVNHHITNNNVNQGFIYWHLAGMWFTFVISAIVLSSFIPALMKVSNQRRSQLAELREKQLKNEQLIGIATLAAGTAHEMGTPLMTMEMLLNDSIEHQFDLNQEDSKLLHQQVNICRQALQRLSLAGREIHNTTQQYINAHEWLTALLHRWRLSQPNALWDDKGIDKLAIITKSPLLDQAILNLLDNAAQAGKDTIEISSKTNEGFWQCTIHQPDQNASNQLKDDHLFASDKEYGLGLGLYLSNASIEQFNGQVHLSANNDGSTSCTIRLPCKEIFNEQS